MTHFKTLEFDTICNKLAACAVSTAAQEKCRALTPAPTVQEAKHRLTETTHAKNIMEALGSPPIAMMADLEKIIALLTADGMLTPDNLTSVNTFLASCTRMRAYLKRAEDTGADIAFYGNAMVDMGNLEADINRCVHNGHIDDRASTALHDLRRSLERKQEQIKAKIEAILKANKQYCTDGFVVMRGGRYTIPLEKKHKNKVPGILVEMSNTGGTCYVEPTAISQLQHEWDGLKIEEENEVRIILYTLTALVYDHLPSIQLNMEAMETLDFLFAKGKLSMTMEANPIRLTDTREIRLLQAKHPLIESNPVPLDFALGAGEGSHKTRGIIITGPNTGGKTVAIKTVGLFALMAQSGLHVPAHPQSSICMFDQVYCDIGDGQSITQNLSTFSSHMTNIISILGEATEQSLVLFDELGSGTDPAEGMGIATAILEELLTTGGLFTVTTHYPEIKDFAATTQGLVNARMAFDRESLLPLYRLEIGEAGESCALHIAQRLGMPPHILERARHITYAGGNAMAKDNKPTTGDVLEVKPLAPEPPKEIVTLRSQSFNIGDSVTVYPSKAVGIVYQRDNGKGDIGVQIKGKKILVNHKRIKLKVPAAELYPEDYDFSIIFDSVENRKARHLMGRKHVAGTRVVVEETPSDV